MSRYIDAEQKITVMYYDEEHEEWFQKIETIDDFLQNADEEIPTADVRKNVHGEWVKSNESTLRPYMCSNCGCLYEVDTVIGKIVWNYCPNCGASMNCERIEKECTETQTKR